MLADQAGHQPAQAGGVGGLFKHAAECLLRKRQVALFKVGEAQCVANLQVLRVSLGGLGQDGQGLGGIATSQGEHAVDGGYFCMVGRDTRRQPVVLFGRSQVAAAQGQLRLQHVGFELVGIKPAGLRQCLLRLVQATPAHQQAGALQVQ